MHLRHLNIFIAVAATGSMSDAARRLYLSQPTVSQSIHELEEHYNILLFERLGRRLYITDAGRQLLSLAHHVTDNYNTLEKSMQKTSTVPSLRLGSSITVGTCLIPSVINDLEAMILNIEILSFVTNTRKIEKKLLRSELDVAVVEGNIESPDLISIPVIDDFLVLACSSRHEFYQADRITPGDLEDRSLPSANREAEPESCLNSILPPTTLPSGLTGRQTARRRS